jgi:glycosyltransferase involved in cell wall biosynthesis
MTSPRVTVIMPVYNVEAYVAEAVESVLAQSFTDFELLIIDDGGSDRSVEICSNFDDPRIRIISQANRGLAGARNTGIIHARGEFIALLDSDDRWTPEKLMLHVIHLDAASDVGVSYSGSRFINEAGVPLHQAQRPKLKHVTAADIFCRNPVGNGSAPVIRKAVLGRVAFPHQEDASRMCHFDESFRQSEDIELWIRLALSADCKFDGIEGLLTEYRIAAGGLSANVVRQYETWSRMVEKVKIIDPAFVASHGTRARAYQLRYLSRRSVQLGDGSFAVSLFIQAMQASIKPLIEEPLKTAATCAAAALASWLKPELLARISQRWTGAKVFA